MHRSSSMRSTSHSHRSHTQTRPITINARKQTNVYNSHGDLPSHALPGPGAPVSHSFSVGGAAVPVGTHTHTHTTSVPTPFPVAVAGLAHSLPLHLNHSSYMMSPRYLDRSYMTFLGYANAQERYLMQEWLALPPGKPSFPEYLVYRWAGVGAVNQLDPMGWAVLQRYQQQRMGVMV